METPTPRSDFVRGFKMGCGCLAAGAFVVILVLAAFVAYVWPQYRAWDAAPMPPP